MRVLLILICFVSVSGFAQPMMHKIETMDFRKASFEEVKEMAKAENKLVFVKCYTKWCKTCKFMNRNVFTDEELAKYFNAHFVSVKLNMEKDEGLGVAEKYEVKAYPTLLFLDTEGKVLLRIEGSLSPKELVQAAHKIIDN